MSEEGLAWKLAVIRSGPCVVTGEPAEQAHHAVTQQKLRKIGRNDLRWDIRNGVPITDRAHDQHHSRHRPILLSELPIGVFEFAEEVLGDAAGDYLSRFYGGTRD